MKRFLLAPDSFKGTMTAGRVCELMSEAIRTHIPDAEITAIPVADGGEGSVDCFLEAMGGERVTVPAVNPYFEEMEGFYGILPGGTAVIEMAVCAGLPLAEGRLAAEKTTTQGVGMLLADAAARHCHRVIMGLGGSATNDGGCGMAAALGVRFLNAAGEAFVPVGETLREIVSIDASGRLPALRGMEIVTMCDIDNPLCGPSGAAHVFGPQKGASPAVVEQLDAGLAHLADVIERDLGVSVRELPGAGAAGGMGAGMAAFFGSRLQMGIETVLEVTGFDEKLRCADLVLSGEGKLDGQSIRGKVVVGVAKHCKAAGVPLIAVVGDVGDDVDAVYEQGVTGIFSTNRTAIPFTEAKKRCESDLRLTVDNLIRCLQALGKTPDCLHP